MEDLQLDFSLLVDEFGVPRRVDLKPGGKDIRVDSSNRIEYIHLVADFYLNRRIRQQCKAFYKGTIYVNILHAWK
jgi:ubiquitin-protein ligase E3 C